MVACRPLLHCCGGTEQGMNQFRAFSSQQSISLPHSYRNIHKKVVGTKDDVVQKAGKKDPCSRYQKTRLTLASAPPGPSDEEGRVILIEHIHHQPWCDFNLHDWQLGLGHALAEGQRCKCPSCSPVGNGCNLQTQVDNAAAMFRTLSPGRPCKQNKTDQQIRKH